MCLFLRIYTENMEAEEDGQFEDAWHYYCTLYIH